MEVVGLEDLIAEFGVTDPTVSADPRFYRILREHRVDGKMLSDVAEEIEEAEWGGPICIINELGGVRRRFEIEEPRELLLNTVHIVSELLAREQIALGGFPGGIADHTSCPASEGEGMVPRELKTAESELAHEMTDVQGVTGRSEATIERERSFSQALGERVKVGAVGQEAAPLQVFDQSHD